MNPIRFEGYNTNFGKPEGWDDERDGVCKTLPVYRFQSEERRPAHISVWAPSPEERARIAAGENVVLTCIDFQVPVSLAVAALTGEEIDLSK